MIELFGLGAGILIGLLGLLPGLHPAVILVGLLPALAIGGDVGAMIIAGALGSSAISTTLAKTFHPASIQTLASATPEQVMAYRGKGPEAVLNQLMGSWVGLATALLIAVPLLALSTIQDLGMAYHTLIKPLAPMVILSFSFLVVVFAGKKLVTVVTMLAATLLGFVAFNHPSFTSVDVMGSLLGGVFAAPTLLMVILSPEGQVKSFPKQLAGRMPTASFKAALGALLGVKTALIAGLGASTAVSIFAGRVKDREYVAMQSASDASNNAIALVLFIVAGITRSGAAVAIQTSGVKPDLWLGLLLLLGVLGGAAIGTIAVTKLLTGYSDTVAALSPKLVAAIVLASVVGFSTWHAGAAGLMLLVVSTLLGLGAKLSFAPNQALLSVLTGPVLIYYLGLSGVVAQTLGIMH